MTAAQTKVLWAIYFGARDEKRIARHCGITVRQARAIIASLLFAGAVVSGPYGLINR